MKHLTLRALVINEGDNVANLIGAGCRGEKVECAVAGNPETDAIDLADDIPAHHKFARCDIRAGQPIVKYGLSIGTATADIRRGQHVHVHNIQSNRGLDELPQ